MQPATVRRPYAARLPVEERREQLLDAAIAVIVRDGYDKVSIDAVAREAGVTRPVIYGVYDGIAPLLSALLDRQQARAMAQLADALPEHPDLSDPDGFLLDAASHLIEVVSANPVTWRPILFAQQGTPQAVQNRIEADREQVREQIAGLLEVGLELRGGPDLDAEVISHALVAILERFGRMLLEDPPRFDPERLISSVRTLLAALRP